MDNENKNIEKYALQMTNAALQQFFNEGNVRLSIEFSNDGKIKKIIAEKRQEDAELNFDMEENIITPSNTKSQSITELELEKEIKNLIREIGIPAHIKGYEYTTTAIMLSIKDSEMLESITKKLYPEVAKKYKTTSNGVERCIRHAVEVTCSKGNNEFLYSVFGYTISPDKGKPVNAQFIATLVDYLKMKLNL